MKNLSLLLNVVLIAAVGFLYYKVYNSQPVSRPAIATGTGMPADAIVFINSDTLLENYNFFKDQKKTFEARQDSIDKMLEGRGKALEKDVMNYQEKAAGMTPEQRMQVEEQLMGRQESLVALRRKLLSDLGEEEDRINDSLHTNLYNYLKEYNKEKNYLFILGYQRGTGILLANDSLDITGEVLEGLNKK